MKKYVWFSLSIVLIVVICSVFMYVDSSDSVPALDAHVAQKHKQISNLEDSQSNTVKNNVSLDINNPVDTSINEDIQPIPPDKDISNIYRY